MFKNVRIILFLILIGTLFTGCLGIFGGDAKWTVEGIVMDENEIPIADASIILQSSTNDTTKTDEDGKWSASVSGKSVTISIEKLGYEFEPKEVIVEKDDNEKSVVFTGKALLDPLFNPEGDKYTDSVTVEIIMVGDYTVYYTVDGSEPTADSIKYTDPFKLIDTTTVKAIAVNNKDTSMVSNVVEATYEIVEENYVQNAGFESESIEPWEGQGNATISIDKEEKASGSQSLFVTNREDIAHGPKQVIDGLEFDVKYNISFKVLYKDGPETRTFNMSHQTGNWETIFNMASGTAKKGEWTTIEGTYEFPKFDKADEPRPIELDGLWIFIETSWVQEPTKENDWMDFWVDDLSITIADQ